jgi:hypothetical protein
MTTAMSRSGWQHLTQEELAKLVPEYQLNGHMLDRVGAPHVLALLGDDIMAPLGIEEWMGASPIYSKRMQKALQFEGDGVETIFKGIQFDIGSPPTYLDFRYKVIDHNHGEFWLDYCGALADVEPMGEEFVHTMCHHIEDPTFDATAIATNPKAQVRPIHRPPRVPAGRTPVCHWTVIIDESYPPVAIPAEVEPISKKIAATVELSPIDPSEPGMHEYSGPLLADIRHSEWSRSALLRMGEEIVVQAHLLVLSFAEFIRRRDVPEEKLAEILRMQFSGVAGHSARRIKAAFGLGDTFDDLATVLAMHPSLGPAQYTGVRIDNSENGPTVTIPADSPAIADGAHLSVLSVDNLEPLNALVREVNPYFRAVASQTADGLVVSFVEADEPAPESGDVALVSLSTGMTHVFGDRKQLPLLSSR